MSPWTLIPVMTSGDESEGVAVHKDCATMALSSIMFYTCVTVHPYYTAIENILHAVFGVRFLIGQFWHRYTPMGIP